MKLDFLSKKLNHYIDLAMGHTESLRTILSILQQMEAKQDLMFQNAPPVPGEVIVEPVEEKMPMASYDDLIRLARLKLTEHKTKVWTEKKRGRPRKTPLPDNQP